MCTELNQKKQNAQNVMADYTESVKLFCCRISYCSVLIGAGPFVLQSWKVWIGPNDWSHLGPIHWSHWTRQRGLDQIESKNVAPSLIAGFGSSADTNHRQQ